MKSFQKIVTLAVLFLSVSFLTAYGKDTPEETFDHVLEKAKQGDAEAQLIVGNSLFSHALKVEKENDGDNGGVEELYANAVSWFRLAAEQNEPNAQFMLGHCYQEGKGVSKDLEEALKWYRKGAENDNEFAQLFLGLYYLKGIVVEKDPKEAVKYFYKSAMRNNAQAQYWIGYCYETELIGEGCYYLKQGDASEWYYKAYMGGYSPALEACDRTMMRMNSHCPHCCSICNPSGRSSLDSYIPTIITPYDQERDYKISPCGQLLPPYDTYYPYQEDSDTH